MYRALAAALEPSITPYAWEPPGRGTRFGEAPLTTWAPHVDAIVEAIHAIPGTDPVSIFGYSFGAILAFEVARAMRRRAVRHLFVAAAPSPRHARGRSVPEDINALATELRKFGGTPDEVLEDPELLALILPWFRDDRSMLASYNHPEECALHVPITAFAGRADHEVELGKIEMWARETTGPFALIQMDAGHFFHVDHAKMLAGVINDALK